MASVSLVEQDSAVAENRISLQRSVSRSKRTTTTSLYDRRTITLDEQVQRCLTNRQRGIVVTMILFATITSAQFGAAIYAHSLALMGDCGSMLVDTFSYGANLWAECHESKNQERNQLIATFVSIIVLMGITGYVIYDSINILTSEGTDDDDVNAYVVFGFALGGLLFDVIGLLALGQGKKEEATGAGDLNLHSAGMHVLADLMRSTTTLVESILIWVGQVDSATTDATAALIVSALILIPCAEMIREWWLEYREYRRKKGFFEESSKPLIPMEN